MGADEPDRCWKTGTAVCGLMYALSLVCHIVLYDKRRNNRVWVERFHGPRPAQCEATTEHTASAVT